MRACLALRRAAGISCNVRLASSVPVSVPYTVNLTSPASLARYASMRRDNDLLLRAVGNVTGTVLDATAGWGRDASAIAFGTHASMYVR